ncbi:MAG: TIGR02301 family protein [Pseudomonadota bacterium]
MSYFCETVRSPLTRKRLFVFACLAFVLSVCVPTHAMAAQRQSDLLALANVFGELHHLRRMCEPARETDLWRERMKQLVSLEQPTSTLRRQMVGQFNTGYRNAQGRYLSCTDLAKEYAAIRAGDGRALSSRLAGRY